MPTSEKFSYRDLHFTITSDASDFGVFEGEREIGRLVRPRVYSKEKWRFTSRDGKTKTEHSFIAEGSARKIWKALADSKLTPVGAMHPHKARTAADIAMLDDQGVVLKYRQLCSNVERAATLHNAVSKHGAEGEAVATLSSLTELTNRRDLFKAEAEKRNLI